MFKPYLAILTIILLLLTACQENKANKENSLARVNDSYLFPESIASDNAGDTSWNKEQINAWIIRQVWVQEAEKDQSSANIDNLVLDYKHSLMIDAYQQKVIAEANVKISDEMVLNYYKMNLERFTLDQDMFKLSYFMIDSLLDVDIVLNKLNNQEANEALDGYCLANPKYCLTEAIWVEKGVLESISIPQYLWNTSVKYQSFYRNDSTVGLFRIESKNKKGEPSPLDLIVDDIYAILKFQKEKEIIDKHGENLLLNAQNNNNFEIY
ncbi:hypothetical protein N9D46_02640 [Chitinophagales bacterium]|nr:hypothetical protein [Chitinophagales bacterium]